MPEPTDLTLQLLRELHNEIVSFRQETHDDLREVKLRLSSLESAVVGLRRDQVSDADIAARQQLRLDGLVVGD